jgi:hypothetical protein
MDPAERATIKAFILEEHQEHYIARLAGTPRVRLKFINQRFDHIHDLDPRFAIRLEPEAQRDAIQELLHSSGAPEECYVFGRRALRRGTGFARSVHEDSWGEFLAESRKTFSD